MNELGNIDGIREDSYCGLYCGACEVLVAHLNAKERGKAARWEDLPPFLVQNMPEAEAVCHGCKTDTVFAGCRGCPMRNCAREKQVEFCFECEEYPCAIIHEMKEAIDRIKETKPHTASIFGNLKISANRGKRPGSRPRSKNGPARIAARG